MLGLDYLYIPNKGEPYGLSQRTGQGHWRTVTMNKPTVRRWTALWGNSGVLLPAVHVQAYLESHADGSKSFLSATVIQVGNLVRYIEYHPGQRKTNHREGSSFLSWTFDQLDATDVSIVTVLHDNSSLPSVRDGKATGRI